MRKAHEAEEFDIEYHPHRLNLTGGAADEDVLTEPAAEVFGDVVVVTPSIASSDVPSAVADQTPIQD